MFEIYNIAAFICFGAVLIFLGAPTDRLFNKFKYWLLASFLFVASAAINAQYKVEEIKFSIPDSYVLNDKTGTSYFTFGEDSRVSHLAVHYLNPSNVVLKTTITTIGNWVKYVSDDGGTLVIKGLE